MGETGFLGIKHQGNTNSRITQVEIVQLKTIIPSPNASALLRKGIHVTWNCLKSYKT